MGFLPEVGVPDGFGPFVILGEKLGFVPKLFRAQTLLPRIIEAETLIAGSVLLEEGALSRTQKETILLTVAVANANSYCVTDHWNVLRNFGLEDATLEQMMVDPHRAQLSPADVSLLDFARKLASRPTRVGPGDIEGLREVGLRDEAVLEVVLTASLAQFLCTLSVGVGADPDFEPRHIPAVPPLDTSPRRNGKGSGGRRPYLRTGTVTAESFPPFVFFQDRFGFVPNIFRAQTLRPDVLESEAKVIEAVLLTEDELTRVQKEYILLVVSAANLNTYCVAVHCEMLRGLGVPEWVTDQIALDHHQAEISDTDAVLLDFALKLARRPADYGLSDIETLRRNGFSDPQILEGIVMTALTGFLNTLQTGLGTIPDFEPRVALESTSLPHVVSPVVPLTSARSQADDDADLVALAKAGDLSAFEELVKRHARRIYRTVIGITGSVEEAEDEVQNAFLKAFQHLKDFQGSSRFSTWLTRIAINEAIERVRTNKRLRELGALRSEEIEESFLPRNVCPWVEDPEQVCSRRETRELVERAIMRLPGKYRMPVLLRDIEQLSGEEAAAALGLSLPTMKTRLLRGRMMLREALAPHFAPRGPRHA